MENDDFSEIMSSVGKACSTRFPGGNLVDGLPPVASNTHAADFASQSASSFFLCDGCLFAIFSVAVNTIVATPGSILDIDRILPHAKGEVQCIPVRGAVFSRSSSCVTRK